MLQIISLEPKPDYKLFVRLSNGRQGHFDVEPYLDKGIFSELKNESYFRQVKIIFGGIMWPNQQDFSTDTIEHELH